MTPDEAIERRRAMHAKLDVPTLYLDVLERMAIRGLGDEWSAVQQGDDAVMLFLRVGDKYLSRYVWRWRDVDWIVDELRGKATVARPDGGKQWDTERTD